MQPHPNNACAGHFDDWLEVNLTPTCNANCSWCVEKLGWHPQSKTDWQTIAQVAIDSGKENIILLGGEPTLYPQLKQLIQKLTAANKKVWITTNGSKLTPDFVAENLQGVTGVNISIHHYLMHRNAAITKIDLNKSDLKKSIECLKKSGAKIRLNCNCIKSYIDCKSDIERYILFADDLGADSVRFAELKVDEDNFVNLAELYPEILSNNPFSHGCSVDTKILAFPVNFRTMCGLQTTKRPKPENPEQMPHQVLYYDGNLYDGWQIKPQGTTMNTNPTLKQSIKGIIERLEAKEISKANAIKSLNDLFDIAIMAQEPVTKIVESSGCRY